MRLKFGIQSLKRWVPHTSTSSQGVFTLDLPDGFEIRVSMPSYTSGTAEVVIS